MSALRTKNTSEFSDPRSYEVTLKAVTNQAQKKFWGSNGIVVEVWFYNTLKLWEEVKERDWDGIRSHILLNCT